MNKCDEVTVNGRTIDLDDFEQFDDHRDVQCVEDEETGLKAVIAIHRSNKKKPSFGATRMWEYATAEEAIKDALRLSRLMSYKSALAGLECGGAKGVISYSPDGNGDKARLLEAYAKKVNELEGAFITGTDVGLKQADIINLQKTSPYFVGLRVNPTVYTAFGLLEAVRTALNHMYGTPKLTDRSFAIQGVGKIGGKFLDLIYQDAKKVYITDIDMRLLRKLKRKYPRVETVDPDEIHKMEVDVFSPCALSLALTDNVLEDLKATLIAGGANNQLATETTGSDLQSAGKIYVPDYVANAGGLVSVVNEYFNKDIEPDELMKSIAKIGERTEEILKASEKRKVSTDVVADEMAKKIISEYEKAK